MKPKFRQFSTSKIRSAVTEFVGIPTILVAHIGREAIYATMLALITIGIYISSPFAVTLESQFISLAQDYLSLITRAMQAIRGMSTPADDPAAIELARNTLDLIRGIISSIPFIVGNFNGIIESTDTMSPMYDQLFDLVSRFEALEPVLRAMYRNLELFLGISIERTQLVPETYELVFNDYVYALGGDPDTAAQAMGESPASSSSPSSDDMDID